MCNKACDKNNGTGKKKSCYSICVAPKDAKHLLASPKDDLFKIMHNEKVIDLFRGNNVCERKGVLRTSLFCFMHKLPTHGLYILSVNAFIACEWMEICGGHGLWRGLGSLK